MLISGQQFYTVGIVSVVDPWKPRSTNKWSSNFEIKQGIGRTLSKLSVEQALAKAKSHTKKGELAEAQALYATILKAIPNSTKAQQGLAASGRTRQANAKQSPPETAINQLANLFNQRLSKQFCYLEFYGWC